MSKTQSTVEYRDIPEFPGYRVGSDGSVWSKWKRVPCGRGKGTRTILSDDWVPLKPAHNHYTGYRHVHIRNVKGRFITKSVHRLVLESFVGPRPRGLECCHTDCDSLNNQLANLRWGTRKDNRADSIRMGKIARGSNVKWAKLNELDVSRIRLLYSTGAITQKELSKIYQVSQSTISEIVTGKNWGHVN